QRARRYPEGRPARRSLSCGEGPPSVAIHRWSYPEVTPGGGRKGASRRLTSKKRTLVRGCQAQGDLLAPPKGQEEKQMGISDSLQVAVEALIANKLRAFLTMLGIIIGVGSVIALMAVGQGSQKAVSQQILGLGSNLLFVRPGSSSSSGVQGGAGSAQTLSTADSDAITASVANITAVAPEL